MVLKSVDNNIDNNLKLTIQPAAIENTKAISAILAQSFYNFPNFASWIYPFLQFTINEDLRYRLRSHSPVYRCFVAKLPQSNQQDWQVRPEYNSDLSIVGTVEIALRSPSLWSTNVQYPYISNLAVNQDFRRRGIGSQLLTKCEEIALDWGYQETRLHVLDSNESAKQLYCHNGYQISHIEANWGNLWFDCSPRLLLKKQIQID
ncbi:MAG TPA: GNAT family N-acetyltransferase [Coleofasciculaceae cyanobacterium]|jgi:ribosomal protein S18 acetylase RimI-like enzyme